MIEQLARGGLGMLLVVGLTLAATACEVEGPVQSPSDVASPGPPDAPPSPVVVAATPDVDPLTHARSICDEGTIAECQAACDSGQAYTCLLLARMAHSGARTPKDTALGESIARGGCSAGALESCAQLALWDVDSDVREAGVLAIRACSSGDAATSRIGCGLWMHLLEQRTYAPVGSDLVEGLRRVCAKEQAGVAGAGRPLGTSMQVFEYDGGACGRLKDLGMRPGDGAR